MDSSTCTHTHLSYKRLSIQMIHSSTLSYWFEKWMFMLLGEKKKCITSGSCAFCKLVLILCKVKTGREQKNHQTRDKFSLSLKKEEEEEAKSGRIEINESKFNKTIKSSKESNRVTLLQHEFFFHWNLKSSIPQHPS